MAFKIGFGAAAKKPGLKNKPLAARNALLDDDEFDVKSAEEASAEVGRPSKTITGLSKSSKSLEKPTLKTLPNKTAASSLQEDLSAQITHKKTVEKALAVDSSIYDYDGAFDAIHAKDAAKKAERQLEKEERKSKYMDNFVAAAEIRKQDLVRAKDKQLQREREAEGDTFADKEKFVTEAYKKQQEEVRQAEIEEKKRQEEEEKKKKAMGMQGFYSSMLEDQDKRYQENMAAAAEARKTGVIPLLADEEKEKTDIDIAKEMHAKGRDIFLNDEGQIVDKRETLTAGLNVIKKPKPAITQKAASSITIQPAWQNKNAPNKQAMRERQSKMMEEQLAQATKRAADDEAEDQRKLEHAAKSRKTDGEIMSAKERYLARKKAAEEEKKKGAT